MKNDEPTRELLKETFVKTLSRFELPCPYKFEVKTVKRQDQIKFVVNATVEAPAQETIEITYEIKENE